MSTWVWAVAAFAAPMEVAAVDGANLQRPRWSRDGSLLAYEANYHEKKRVDLYVGSPGAAFQKVSASRAGSSALTEGFQKRSDSAVAQELSWGPASLGRFVYSAATDSLDYDLYISGGSAVAPGPDADGSPAWSPDGGLIAFTSARSGEGDLYVVDVGAIEKPPRQITALPSSSELFAAWSAGGSLAYVAHTGTGDNLWYLASVGGTPVQLTNWSGSQVRPTFSPDGKRVAFYANRDDVERFDLYVLAVGEAQAGGTQVAGDAKRLATGVVPDLSGPSWTPDGKHLVFVRDENAAYDPVVAVRADGTVEAVLDLGTVGNGDLDLTVRQGAVWCAWVAQGRMADAQRSFARLFAGPLPALP